MEMLQDNEWPAHDSMKYLRNQLGWDMGATIEANNTSPEATSHPKKLTFVVNIGPAMIRHFHFDPTKQFRLWSERADPGPPTDRRTWPVLTHSMCKFGNRENCTQNGGWGETCLYCHYGETPFAVFMENGPESRWTRIQLAPGLITTNEAHWPQELLAMSPERLPASHTLVMGNHSTVSRMPTMAVEEFRAHLPAARISPTDSRTVTAFGEGIMDRLRSELE